MRTNRLCIPPITLALMVFTLATVAFAQETETVLYSLRGMNGSFPSGLTFDQAGNIFGAAGSGGEIGVHCYGCGTIFELSPAVGGGWTETTLYAFAGGTNLSGGDGGNDYRGVVVDAQGNLFGVTFVGGTAPCECGTVFELSPNPVGGYTYQLLYSFNDFADGGYPISVILDAKGNLYGTTQDGGGGSNGFCDGCGAIFELSPPAVQGDSWTETTLYDFTGNADGVSPEGLVLDKAGNLYGFALYGGELGNEECYGRAGCGTAFRLSPNSDGSWAFSVIYTFQPSDGSEPLGAPVFDASGNLFGGGSAGGKACPVAFGEAFGCGTIFELSPPMSGTISGESSSNYWHISMLHAFSGIYDGAFPVGSLTFDAAGNLYGATSGGGDTACGQSHGCGTVFELSPVSGGGWIFTRLWAFPNQANGGDRPVAGVVLDAAGNLYGSTGYGGYYQNKQCAATGCGVIYELPSVAVGIAK